MTLHEIFFWILSFGAILGAIGVIFSRNPVNSVLCLISTFFMISGHYILMNAQFLSIVNIIVYAGAIMVLFLFVIMLMNLNADTEPQKGRLIIFAAVISGGILFLVILSALRSAQIDTVAITSAGEIGLIKVLGKKLFTDFVLPFELSSVLFLSAMVGAMVLGKKEKNTDDTLTKN